MINLWVYLRYLFAEKISKDDAINSVIDANDWKLIEGDFFPASGCDIFLEVVTFEMCSPCGRISVFMNRDYYRNWINPVTMTIDGLNQKLDSRQIILIDKAFKIRWIAGTKNIK